MTMTRLAQWQLVTLWMPAASVFWLGPSPTLPSTLRATMKSFATPDHQRHAARPVARPTELATTSVRWWCSLLAPICATACLPSCRNAPALLQDVHHVLARECQHHLTFWPCLGFGCVTGDLTALAGHFTCMGASRVEPNCFNPRYLPA